MRLIAHRCGTDRYPEQSMQAARFSLSENVDFIEMDVRFTREGVPVICHDSDVGRVFGVAGRVEDMDLASFLSLRNAQRADCVTYTLDTVFEEGLCPALLHLKCDGDRLDKVLERIAAHGAQKKSRHRHRRTRGRHADQALRFRYSGPLLHAHGSGHGQLPAVGM